MQPSRITALFTQPPSRRREPTSVILSLLFHGVALGGLAFDLRPVPYIKEVARIHPLTVRFLRLNPSELQLQRSLEGSVPHSPSHSSAGETLSGDGPALPPAPPVPQVAHVFSALQTLVQPDAPPLPPSATPLPSIVLWSAQHTPSPTIVPPAPQEASITGVRPSFDPPNREPNPADLKLAATNFPANIPQLPPSTTSPLVVREPKPPQPMPESAVAPLDPPTPTALISLSDLPPQPANIAIPFRNQGVQITSSETSAIGRAEQASGSGAPGTTPGGSRAERNKPATAAKASGDPALEVQPGVGSPLSQPGADSSSGLGGAAGGTRIMQPKDGQFGVVVVGTSLSERYPETAAIWGGRLVYTVYLHVGLGKSWILQYSMPLAKDAAVSGSALRPEAPWPYEIVRPSLDPADFQADAILVHGVVNLAGDFEQLAIVQLDMFQQLVPRRFRAVVQHLVQVATRSPSGYFSRLSLSSNQRNAIPSLMPLRQP